MTNSLAADSRTWWLPSAFAGGIGAAAVAAILILPTSGHAVSPNNAPDAPPVSVRSDDDSAHRCFMQRPPRIYGIDRLPQSPCQ